MHGRESLRWGGEGRRRGGEGEEEAKEGGWEEEKQGRKEGVGEEGTQEGYGYCFLFAIPAEDAPRCFSSFQVLESSSVHIW